MVCKEQADYTDMMVLDILIRGLADEEIKRKVLATPETKCTIAKVLRFVEAEESQLQEAAAAGLGQRLHGARGKGHAVGQWRLVTH